MIVLYTTLTMIRDTERILFDNPPNFLLGTGIPLTPLLLLSYTPPSLLLVLALLLLPDAKLLMSALLPFFVIGDAAVVAAMPLVDESNS